MAGKISPLIMEKIKQASVLPQTAVSLRQMVEFGRAPSQATMLHATQFIHNELPIRLARRVVELENLPDHLSSMPSIHRVKNWYSQSFQDLVEFPRPEEFGIPKELASAKLVSDRPVSAGPINVRYYNPMSEERLPPEVAQYNKKFVTCIENIKKRHDPVATTIAKGIQELKEHWSFLDRFYMSRIGIRMLIGQHVALAKASVKYVGIICTKTSIRKVALEAAENARVVCQDFYGLWGGPEIRLLGKDDVEFMYVPSHLHHMLFELLKNSLRAVVERFGVDADEYPEIRIVEWDAMIWTNPSWRRGFSKSDFRAPLAGFGYGLPLSRLYARYFGGDMRLISMEGYGNRCVPSSFTVK
ncbi:mitochondrial branched-chain alpha-ketoacid dehydrogenase kinase-domain-containing protein [Chytridium lagenaria]|nr:mitochondrial branched-chain alpha-ketoacid dehydrogenase kinase-domain-containing protein [Chytridium lagenaria]